MVFIYFLIRPLPPLQRRLQAHCLMRWDIQLGLQRVVPPPGGRGTLVNVCWVCAAGLSEPLPHYSLFFGKL